MQYLPQTLYYHICKYLDHRETFNLAITCNLAYHKLLELLTIHTKLHSNKKINYRQIYTLFHVNQMMSDYIIPLLKSFDGKTEKIVIKLLAGFKIYTDESIKLICKTNCINLIEDHFKHTAIWYTAVAQYCDMSVIKKLLTWGEIYIPRLWYCYNEESFSYLISDNKSFMIINTNCNTIFKRALLGSDIKLCQAVLDYVKKTENDIFNILKLCEIDGKHIPVDMIDFYYQNFKNYSLTKEYIVCACISGLKPKLMYKYYSDPWNCSNAFYNEAVRLCAENNFDDFKTAFIKNCSKDNFLTAHTRKLI